MVRLRVAFGHQSVGEDILQALGVGGSGDCVAVARAGVVEAEFHHRRIGRNGDPQSKIDEFVAWCESGIGAWAHVALFKFCYVDVSPATDVDGLLAAQRTALDHLRHKLPETRFLECTIPLTVNPGLVDRLVVGVRRAARHPALAANIRRNQFNALLRAGATSRSTLFDLASLESRGMLGPTAALHPTLARDHGHLAEEAAGMIGQEFLRCLSEVGSTIRQGPAYAGVVHAG